MDDYNKCTTIIQTIDVYADDTTFNSDDLESFIAHEEEELISIEDKKKIKDKAIQQHGGISIKALLNKCMRLLSEEEKKYLTNIYFDKYSTTRILQRNPGLTRNQLNEYIESGLLKLRRELEK